MIFGYYYTIESVIIIIFIYISLASSPKKKFHSSETYDESTVLPEQDRIDLLIKSIKLNLEKSSITHNSIKLTSSVGQKAGMSHL
jgi:hypothetical protein